MILQRARLPFILLIAVLIFSGCDAADPGADTVFLTYEITQDVNGDPIALDFEAGSIQTGRLQDLDCNCQLDIGSYLTSQGFSKSEIVSATLQSAQIVMLFPVNENVSFLDQAILKLTASGISATEVANTSSFPASRTANMTVLPNRDIGSFLDRPSFGLILQIDPERLLDAQDYEMSLVMTVRLELEGV